MVDQCRSKVKDEVLTAYVKDVDKCQTIDAMVEPTLAAIRQLATLVLANYIVILARRGDP